MLHIVSSLTKYQIHVTSLYDYMVYLKEFMMDLKHIGGTVYLLIFIALHFILISI